MQRGMKRAFTMMDVFILVSSTASQQHCQVVALSLTSATHVSPACSIIKSFKPSIYNMSHSVCLCVPLLLVSHRLFQKIHPTFLFFCFFLRPSCSSNDFPPRLCVDSCSCVCLTAWQNIHHKTWQHLNLACCSVHAWRIHVGHVFNHPPVRYMYKINKIQKCNDFLFCSLMGTSMVGEG